MLLNKKIIFAGTPSFAAVQLQSLIQAGYEIVAVYTQPDRPQGRGRKLLPSEVKKVALQNSIPVYQPENFKDSLAVEALKKAEPALMIVSAYGLLLPRSVLAVPAYGCWNVHASLLPKYRGAAPIQYAILSGETHTGVTLMQMDAGMDTGDMLLSAKTKIGPKETSQTLHDRLAQMGAQLLLEALQDIESTRSKATTQPTQGASYAPKISKDEAQLNFRDEAHILERKVRAYIPWPVAFFQHNDLNIKVHQASYLSQSEPKPPGTIVNVDENGLVVACKQGSLRIEQLQLPGKKPVEFSAFLNAHSDMFTPGDRLPI